MVGCAGASGATVRRQSIPSINRLIWAGLSLSWASTMVGQTNRPCSSRL